MSPQMRHALDDQATVDRLLATSGGDDPRDYLTSCRVCSNPLWAGIESNPRMYCGPLCRNRAHYRSHRDTILARQNARHQRVRDARDRQRLA